MSSSPLQIEPVRAVEFADQASKVLMTSWPRPCINYSPEYLAWHFRFPGALPPLAVAAFEGRTLAAFIAAVNRRLQFQGECRDIYLASFLAVHPDFRGRRIATALLDNLIKLAKPSGAPIVGFVDPKGLSGPLVNDCFLR